MVLLVELRGLVVFLGRPRPVNKSRHGSEQDLFLLFHKLGQILPLFHRQMPLLYQELAVAKKIPAGHEHVDFPKFWVDCHFVLEPEQELLHVVFYFAFENEDHVLDVLAEHFLHELLLLHLALLVAELLQGGIVNDVLNRDQPP